jgi:REP element-mobilizing transposase RayT
MFWHLTAHTLAGLRPMASDKECGALFRALRRCFPRVAAAVVMPNHVHLLVEASDPDAARRRLARCLAAFARRSGAGRMWQPVAEPVPIRDAKQLERQIRYVHLNPCRAGLVDDPLCWPWSTHRGVVGAELHPWVSPADLATYLGRREAEVPRWLHDYVSCDPSVNVTGTPFPDAAPARNIPAVSLADIVAAADAAMPGSAPRRRQLFALLARHQGWRDARLVAQAAGITPSQIRRLARRSDPALVRLGALHLGDARLRHVPDFRGRPRY